jgi:hypothetical protein
VNAVADFGDDAGRIKTKGRRQVGQGLVGKPRLPIVKDVAQVRNDAASFHLQQNVGRTWPRRCNRVKAHGLAHGMHSRRKHHFGDGCLDLLH